MEDKLVSELLNSLCDEFQSVWIVDAKTLAMRIFAANEEESIPESIETVMAFQNYDTARLWYVDNCVAPADRNRLREQSAVDYISTRIDGGKPYYIEYSRINGSKINYNQLFYAKLDTDSEALERFVLGFRDIDVRKKAERDDLTGCYTRQVFIQKAEKMLKDNPDMDFDLMISDIVDFKEINEIYGTSIGDDILRWTGSFLAPAINDYVAIGRYGGDQFVILGPHEFVQAVNSPESVALFDNAAAESGLPKTITKYGVYEGVHHNRSIIATCDKAHMALNSIKQHYEKRIAYYGDALRREIEVSRTIANSMHQALEEEQFKVYYQPKHDAETGKLIGAEALIRWIHPEYGFMSPGDFIPLFEKNGFVVETDFYVWKRTCQNLRRWEDKGIKTVPISVNSSKLTFEQDDLLKKLQVAVDENHLSPNQLHIEITETMMTYDVDSLIRKLTDIRSIGYQIELDDFGSGYSSINILSTLPIDVVKLDMSFMKQFGDDKRAKVLAACIKLARELGYKTVSEGVEMKEQCDMLNVLGVDAIQGFYYSRPLPEAEFEAYMIANCQ